MNRRALVLIGLFAAVANPVLAQARPRRLGERLRDRRHGAGPQGNGSAHTTVAYGSHPNQAFDVYDNTGATGAILVFVHGGGWAHGDKSMVHALPDYARRHGLTLVSVGYRLVPEVSPREQAQDLAAAIARLHQAWPERPIVLLGHSAGAHLVALVGVDPQYLAAYGLAPSDLAGIIPLDGAGFDATQPRPGGRAGRQLERLYETAFGDDRAALSPTLQVRPGVAYPPFLIFHIASRPDSSAQSHALAQALVAAGGHAEVVAAPGDSHSEINREFGRSGDAEGERAARFLARLNPQF